MLPEHIHQLDDIRRELFGGLIGADQLKLGMVWFATAAWQVLRQHVRVVVDYIVLDTEVLERARVTYLDACDFTDHVFFCLWILEQHEIVQFKFISLHISMI